MKKLIVAASVAATCLSGAVFAQGVDALSAKVNSEDADRFVAVFERTDGKPTAEDLLKGYLEPGSKGVQVFTPGRIVNAENLAQKIAANPDSYRRAIDVCLPIAKDMTAELRSVYLGLNGLLNSPELPELFVLFGAGNSGGTAGPGAQVLGLEVICRIGKDEEDIRGIFRRFFAHETVHTLQNFPSKLPERGEEYLILSALAEGGADFVASLVTGQPPERARDAWAVEREGYIKAEFLKDLEKARGMTTEEIQKAGSPLYRWVRNSTQVPDEGWPGELGYWVGRQIWTDYFNQAEDKEAVLKQLLDLDNIDPEEISSIYFSK
ncbi:hypothetical protein KFE96_01590 [Kordiimonas sp. SCSIO 12603]|uniref:hypothetical protein n=1 Tax=Kordiimonas sp. SCSIO 12603 TaxID=2829596 RepID=UPI0021047120|nr:hypothetical protein [Kordiimonas sp. SCSIO 12603]UTW59027.1 hypothetical protein KFE96_01590 [Kordiimonas sp. SCSIO 12603]